jgi:hypothetical protein
MGTYDTFTSKDGKVQVQLKAGACAMSCYEEGDPCPEAGLRDGTYQSSEGYVAIIDQKVYSVRKEDPELWGLPLFSKWGDELAPGGEKHSDYNYVAKAVKAVERKHLEKVTQDKCGLCGSATNPFTEDWKMNLCAYCYSRYDSAEGSVRALIEAAYEAGRASVLGTKLEPDEEVEQGMR